MAQAASAQNPSQALATSFLASYDKTVALELNTKLKLWLPAGYGSTTLYTRLEHLPGAAYTLEGRKLLLPDTLRAFIDAQRGRGAPSTPIADDWDLWLPEEEPSSAADSPPAADSPHAADSPQAADSPSYEEELAAAHAQIAAMQSVINQGYAYSTALEQHLVASQAKQQQLEERVAFMERLKD